MNTSLEKKTTHASKMMIMMNKANKFIKIKIYWEKV